MTSRNVWPAVVLASVGAVIGCIMAIMKVPTDTIALVASLMVVPVLTALVTAQISELKGTTTQLSSQTNGNWSKMIELLAQSPPVPPHTPPTSAEAPPNAHETQGS